MEYTLMVYSLHGKDMVLLKIVFRSGNRHGKDSKCHLNVPKSTVKYAKMLI